MASELGSEDYDTNVPPVVSAASGFEPAPVASGFEPAPAESEAVSAFASVEEDNFDYNKLFAETGSIELAADGSPLPAFLDDATAPIQVVDQGEAEAENPKPELF
jgi:hypothetical protein